MKYFLVDAGRNVISKKIEDGLTSSYITKVNRCLENRLLLKRASRKLTSQEGGFLNFLRPLMSASLPIMKNKLTTLAKTVLIRLGLTAAVSATDATIQKKIFDSRNSSSLENS